MCKFDLALLLHNMDTLKESVPSFMHKLIHLWLFPVFCPHPQKRNAYAHFVYLCFVPFLEFERRVCFWADNWKRQHSGGEAQLTWLTPASSWVGQSPSLRSVHPNSWPGCLCVATNSSTVPGNLLQYVEVKREAETFLVRKAKSI